MEALKNLTDEELIEVFNQLIEQKEIQLSFDGSGELGSSIEIGFSEREEKIQKEFQRRNLHQEFFEELQFPC